MAQRREVFYTGQVQGVGFRYTAARLARRYEVSGFVQNLADGRVYLVAEGAVADLDAYLAEVARAMRGYIEALETNATVATGEWDGFMIRHSSGD
jgi:acylphosphatase